MRIDRGNLSIGEIIMAILIVVILFGLLVYFNGWF